MNILVVDDHETSRKLLRAQLEAEGHHVLEAGDGVQALVELERTPVDGVISDILMPNMDGFRLCREIRLSDKFSALSFILYTSTYDSPTDRQLAKDVGADHYVVKPAPVPAIIEALRGAIQISGERKPPEVQQPDEGFVLKQYSEVLVRKLDTKNCELQEALGKLNLAHQEIMELNRNLEIRVAERTGQLAAANKELEAFSYSISHDLRSPLRAIVGFAHILQNEYAAALPAAAQEYLGDIRTSAQHMSHLVDDLLSFSRLSRQPINKQPVETRGLVCQCLEELRGEQGGRRVEVQVGDLPACSGDPGLLKQVWANLLSNAIKYTGRRETAVIEVGSRVGDDLGRTTYFVKDNGAGFDMRYAHKLFGVFQRLHRAEEYAGTGVGLAIVQRIVQRHGGCIWAEAQLDQGATFYFTLASDGRQI